MAGIPQPRPRRRLHLDGQQPVSRLVAPGAHKHAAFSQRRHRSYVQGLGARLRIVAVFDDGEDETAIPIRIGPEVA